mmetsp:Transcript_48457/g.86272  ORF Transcript_48457/g.86272 Transcript_48457/m.86272 type:complete len:262 (-) Transcript_48457:76-861(-)
MLIALSISLNLINYGMLFIPLILLSSLLGLVMILFLLRYGSESGSDNDDVDLYDFCVIIFLILWLTFINNTMISSNNNSLISLLNFSIILESSLWISLLFAIVFIATLLLIHLSTKVMYFSINPYFNSIIAFWLTDMLILGLIGTALCFLPAILRWYLNRASGKVTGKRWREEVYRWTSDVYEVGISVPGTSLPSGLFGKNGESESGSLRFLAFVYLFLLLDLESCIVIVGFLGYCQIYWMLLFLLVLLLSLGCELSKDPL